MKCSILLFGVLFLGSGVNTLSAQKPHREVDTTPVLGDVAANKERLTVDYKVPYDGVAEFKIYNPDSVKIYHENLRCFIGLNTIRVKFHNVKSGTYSYRLEYKGHEIKSTFEIQ